MPDREAKERILKAAMELMDEVEDTERITIRQIAERAGVGIGLINYHFQTRENLLYAAIGEYMTHMIAAIQQAPSQAGTPEERFRAMLRSLGDIGLRYEKQMRVGAQFQLLQGDFSAANFLLPLLREIFAGKRDESAVRLIAFQILVTTNAILLRSDAFLAYAGIDLRDKAQRDRLMDTLIDHYLS